MQARSRASPKNTPSKLRDSVTPSVYNTSESPGQRFSNNVGGSISSTIPIGNDESPHVAPTLPSARRSKPGGCPQFPQNRFPVGGSSDTKNAVTKIPGTFTSRTTAFTSCGADSRIRPNTRNADNAARNTAIITAAAAPCPDTSAIANPNRPSSNDWNP